eukprot:6468499-Amphidinium_carterae.6
MWPPTVWCGPAPSTRRFPEKVSTELRAPVCTALAAGAAGGPPSGAGNSKHGVPAQPEEEALCRPARVEELAVVNAAGAGMSGVSGGGAAEPLELSDSVSSW